MTPFEGRLTFSFFKLGRSSPLQGKCLNPCRPYPLDLTFEKLHSSVIGVFTSLLFPLHFSHFICLDYNMRRGRSKLKRVLFNAYTSLTKVDEFLHFGFTLFPRKEPIKEFFLEYFPICVTYSLEPIIFPWSILYLVDQSYELLKIFSHFGTKEQMRVNTSEISQPRSCGNYISVHRRNHLSIFLSSHNLSQQFNCRLIVCMGHILHCSVKQSLFILWNLTSLENSWITFSSSAILSFFVCVSFLEDTREVIEGRLYRIKLCGMI